MMRALARDERAAITVLGAISMTACAGCLAFAVDMGSVYFESRRLQGIANAAALSAAADLGDAQQAAEAAAAANVWDRPVILNVTTGRYLADPDKSVAQRFTPRAGGGATGGGPVDAVRVTARSEARLFFGIAALGRKSLRIERSATAARADLASFSLGSRLLALDGGIANALLTGLTGSKISLSVMDYNALVDADVDLLAFSEALQTELDVVALSFDRTLATDITTPRALNALAVGLDKGGSSAAASAVRKLAGVSKAGAPFKLDRLIDLGPIGPQDRAIGGQSVKVNAFDLMRAMLELANGKRQIALDLGASVPGVANLKVDMSVGDRPVDSPWLTVTDKGEPIVRTAQTRLRIDANLAPAGSLLGIASVRIPLYVELAEAEAKLESVSCRGGRNGTSVGLLVRPAIGHAVIADTFPANISDHRTPLVEGPAKIVAVPLVAVSGQARVDLTGPGWKQVSFSAADIAERKVKTVDSTSLVEGIAISLVKKLQLSVNVGGLGIGATAVGALVGNTLTPAAPVLDGVINSLTGLLGIHLGQADVRVNGARCGVPALVA